MARLAPCDHLITGASSGIGATYADRLARRGHPLKLVARDAGRLEAVAERLRAETGIAIETRLADLTRSDALRDIAEWIAADSSLGLLVNNAGVAMVGSMLDGDPDRLEAMIPLNTIASTRLALAAARKFATRGTGTIINIASVVALMPERFHGVYSGTKAHLLNFSQALHGEVGPLGVRVQIVLPGATRTAIWENAGTSAEALPSEMLMDVNEMVDAALAGLDQGELVSIPSAAGPGARRLGPLGRGPPVSRVWMSTKSGDCWRCSYGLACEAGADCAESLTQLAGGGMPARV